MCVKCSGIQSVGTILQDNRCYSAVEKNHTKPFQSEGLFPYYLDLALGSQLLAVLWEILDKTGNSQLHREKS
jgi:hypothetical protein